MLYYYETDPINTVEYQNLGYYFITVPKYKRYLFYYEKWANIDFAVSLGIILEDDNKEKIKLKLVANNKYVIFNFYKVSLFGILEKDNYIVTQMNSPYENLCGDIIMHKTPMHTIKEIRGLSGLLVPRMANMYERNGLRVRMKL